MTSLRLGLVGYGTGGRGFHAPFILAANGLTLAGVVARAPATVARVEADLPGTPVFASLGAMIAAGGVDAVTITTPPETRAALVLEAIDAGLHVVADKPFAPSAAAARELAAAAKKRSVVLGVFHNRRLDADFRTLRKLVAEGRLGQIWRLHSRMDLDEPETIEAGPTGGLLRDLDSHLVDQALFLLGAAVSVHARLDTITLPAGATDAGFVLAIDHEGGARSHLSASKANRLVAKEYRAYGSAGSYVSSMTEVQAREIFAGRRPADDPAGWGYEPEANWGTLRTAAGAERIPSEAGRYQDHYEAFARAVRDGGPPPVTANEAAAVLAVLDAARESAETGRAVDPRGF